MGLLRSIETGIERVVDGTVGRVVRVSVQPVEIARKLAKELEDGKTQSGGRTFVPSQYTVYLPPKDRERFSEYEASLRVELGAYLAEHVRREGYSVLARPRVTFETAEELAAGTFGIATEREAPPEQAPRRTVQAMPVPEPPPTPVVETPALAPEPLVPDPDPLLSQDVVVEPESLVPEPLEPELQPELTLERDPEPESAVAEAEAGLDPNLSPVEPVEDAEDAEDADWHSPLPDLGPPSAPLPTPPVPAASPPAPFLPVPTPPVALPPLPVDEPAPAVSPSWPDPAPDPEPARWPEPEPVAVTQSVSAAEAARAGLAHAADALIVDDRRYPLSGPVTVIGRSSACDVPLDDASASRRHAELRRRGGKTVLVDLDSTNGTLVNGRRVREAPLRAGDRITIGTTTIVYERAS